MHADTFLVTQANTLALQSAEACVKGDGYFRLLLICGPSGTGKSTLLRRMQRLAADRGEAGLHWEDPLRTPVPAAYPKDMRLVATLNDGAPDAAALRRQFQECGGRVVSLVLEMELAHAVARETAATMSMVVHPEALDVLVERLHTPDRVRGALQRLEAEATLQGKREIDPLFALRALGEFLYPRG